MNLFSIPAFLTSILILWFGFFAYGKRTGLAVNQAFFLVCMSVAAWLFFSSISYNCSTQAYAEFFMRLCYLGIVFMPATIIHFILAFLQLKRLRIVVWVSYLTSLIFSVLVLCSNYIVGGLIKYFWGYYPQAGFLHPLFLFFLFCSVIFSYIFTAKIYTIDGVSLIRKRQIEYIWVAFLVLIISGLDFIPNYGIPMYPFGYIPAAAFLGIMAYSIIKYRLLDIATLITRTAIFISVYIFVLGIPFFISYYFQQFFIALLNENWWFIPLIVSTVLATSGPFLYLFINSKAEEKLLKEQKSYQNILRAASSGMIRIKNLNKLLNLIVRMITKTVKIKHAAIYLFDQINQKYLLQNIRKGELGELEIEKFIELDSSLICYLGNNKKPVVVEEALLRLKDNPANLAISALVDDLKLLSAALVIPSFIEDKLIGILVLGEKKSRKLYSQDDINVFSVLANQAALAIENAQFYEEIKQTHEQLFQAEKMATIGTMADGLSHQINNRFHALSLIAGDSLDMLKTFDWSGCNECTKQVMTDLKNALERIENNVLQGGEIVKGILKYSRPGDSGFEPISFKDVLMGSIDMVQYKIRLKEIDIVQNIVDSLPKIYGNLTQLQEVFFNMIDNAYDAIKERQMTLKEEGYRGKIEVSATAQNDSVEIMVADNGMGVKDLDKKKLFTPFFTTKATAKKGTGLGLYVIEKIILAHKGKLLITSDYKQGTKFQIQLPLSLK